MLRVGLTGGLGSGKSTVAAMLREMGAEVVEADQLGRTLMEPGQPVYNDIVRVFGSEVVRADGTLNRQRLADMAFREGRLQELNAIVHPAVIEVQQGWMNEVFERNPNAVAVVESALIFEVERDARARGESSGPLADWRNRFDHILVLTAPDEVKVQRFVDRTCTEGIPTCREAALVDARLRLSRQMTDAEKAARADFVLENTGDLGALRAQVASIYERLRKEGLARLQAESLERMRAESNNRPSPGSLE